MPTIEGIALKEPKAKVAKAIKVKEEEKVEAPIPTIEGISPTPLPTIEEADHITSPFIPVSNVDTADAVVCIVNTTSPNDDAVDTTDGKQQQQQQQQQVSKKRKPLPIGYICRACGEVGMHAIYECPLKVPLKKLKTVASDHISPSPASICVELDEEKLEQKSSLAQSRILTSSAIDNKNHITATTHTSHINKHVVFISGLPFNCKRNEVIAFFQSEGIGSDLTGKDVRLVMFDDSPQRCKGLAYVTLHSEVDYQRALELTNRTMAGRVLSIEVCKTSEKKTAVTSHGSSQVKQMESGYIKIGRKQQNDSASMSGTRKRISRCYRCGMLHDVNQCTNKRICYRCKSTEHLSNQCPLKKAKV